MHKAQQRTEQGINSVFRLIQPSNPHSGQQRGERDVLILFKSISQKEHLLFLCTFLFIRSSSHSYEELQGKLHDTVFVTDGYIPSHKRVVQLFKIWGDNGSVLQAANLIFTAPPQWQGICTRLWTSSFLGLLPTDLAMALGPSSLIYDHFYPHLLGAFLYPQLTVLTYLCSWAIYPLGLLPSTPSLNSGFCVAKTFLFLIWMI